ncbi:hypothetical protein [Geminisphaera colitermitum]|uniref:hypothetical protein n=1 Tax=Geminisphaera colitermitum TaxID=1148786 RepID=UPI0001965555|nr:hypothetical protein [Geminisphaera colitermitum]
MSGQLASLLASMGIATLSTIGGVLIGDHLATVRQRKAEQEKQRFYKRLHKTLTQQGRN